MFEMRLNKTTNFNFLLDRLRIVEKKLIRIKRIKNYANKRIKIICKEIFTKL